MIWLYLVVALVAFLQGLYLGFRLAIVGAKLEIEDRERRKNGGAS